MIGHGETALHPEILFRTRPLCPRRTSRHCANWVPGVHRATEHTIDIFPLLIGCEQATKGGAFRVPMPYPVNSLAPAFAHARQGRFAAAFA